MKESLMWKKLKKHLEKSSILLQRIESGRTGLGIPDIYYTKSGSSGWIELKELPYEFKTSIPYYINIPFRKGQLAWISKFSSYINNIYILMTTKDNIWILIQSGCVKPKMKYSNLLNNSYHGSLAEINIYKKL